MDLSLLESSEIKALKGAIRSHEIYQTLTDIKSLRLFMDLHVFAVWDFMSLLKSLQKDLCGTCLPWIPTLYPRAARLINQIIVDEETDVAPGGGYLSHFQLYLQAMNQVGGDTRLILAWLQNPLIQQMRDHSDSFDSSWIPSLTGTLPTGAREFVATTLGILESPVAVRAAVFFHGREDIVAFQS